MKAAALLEVGRAAAARQRAAAVLADDPDNVEAWCLMARAHHADDDFPAMRAAAARAVAVAPDQAAGHVLLAFACVGLQEGEPARTAALEAVRLAPHDWRAHTALGLAELGTGHPRRAFRSAGRAVALAPDESAPHRIRAMMLQAVGLTMPASKSFRKALALDPQDTTALVGLARAAIRSGRLVTAARHLGAALSFAPTDGDARTQLDRLLIGAVGGWTVVVVWCAGLLGGFAMLPWMWPAPPLLIALWAGAAARVWGALSPGLRAYAAAQLRTDPRARTRVAAAALCLATGAALTVDAARQDPAGTLTAAMAVLFGVHILALLLSGAAVMIADRLIAGPPRAGTTPSGAATGTDLLAEHREDSFAGRWALRVTRVGALCAAAPWVMSVDPPRAWPDRALAAAAGLVVLAGHAVWSRRRLIRRPGPPNAVLGVLLLPLSLAFTAEVVTIAAAAILPTGWLPLPDVIAVPGFVSIVGGVLAWLGWLAWLPYAAVRHLVPSRRPSSPGAGTSPGPGSAWGEAMPP
ncbi:hypothetical protein GCM10010170_009650 [Dactylosporangium salmoneum]|uniref:Tetratricopeptide repeat protein n=1 Tax=Dactylosporangium salmoneum TaxID=53361 RepID=A0ABP5SHH7_9ACTN